MTLLARSGVSRRGVLGTVGACVAGLLGAATVTGDDGNGADGDETGGDGGDRYVVGLEPGTASASVARNAAAVHRSLDLASGGRIVVGTFDEDARAELEARSDVAYVERDRRREPLVHGAVEPAAVDDELDDQRVPWGVERVGAAAFHDSAETGAGASVAVLDSGIDPEHESLEVEEGAAFAECSGASCAADWDDETGHGTHCAGTIAALDNGTGVVGVAPGIDLCALKVLAGDGSGYDSDIAAAIEWCADNDIDVINLSLGGSDTAKVLEDALQYAYERGVLIVAAAGNEGSMGGVDYPAAYDECIAVGSTDERDEVPDWSARGETVELVAPGEEVLSTKPDDEYAYMSGTSMSTPHVAAIAATLMGQGIPHVEDAEDVDDPGGVRGILRETAEDVGFDDDEQGYGLLNAFDALEELEPIATEEVSDVRADAATFTGSLRSLEDADGGEVAFQWREADGDEWAATEPEPAEAGETFSASVDDLSSDTAYDVRAVLDDGSETATGNVVSFETGLETLAVETDDVEVVDHRSVAVTAALAGLGGADSVDVSCRVRPADDDEWESTDPHSLEAVETIEETITGLEPETTYEVEAVAEGGGDAATGEAVAFETDPEPGLPAIDRFELGDDSSSQFVRCNVHWRVSDRDGALELVETELRYADGDEVLHRVASEVEGAEESGVHTVRNSDRLEGAGEEYEVRIAVTDAEGHVTEETERITLDERSPAPSVDRLEVSTDDFLGTPEVVVDWAVSDEGEELDGVELELRPADGDVVDSASAMARGEEASGTDSLRDRNGNGGDYEVTLLATDYFEQTTEETVRVTLE